MINIMAKYNFFNYNLEPLYIQIGIWVCAISGVLLFLATTVFWLCCVHAYIRTGKIPGYEDFDGWHVIGSYLMFCFLVPFVLTALWSVAGVALLGCGVYFGIKYAILGLRKRRVRKEKETVQNVKTAPDVDAKFRKMFPAQSGG